MKQVEAGIADPRHNGGTRRRADVQGLRGIAVLLVVAYHAQVALPGGFLGVDVFLVISGFVITGLLVRGLPRGVAFASFYARRARRLLPLLAITLVATTVTAAGLLDPTGPADTTAVTAAAAALLNANTYLGRLDTAYFDQEPTANALLHTWSLSLEEQFYIVFPAFVLLAWNFGRRRSTAAGWLGAALIGAGITSWAVAFKTGSGGAGAATGKIGFASPQTFAFYAAPARVWEFIAGALLALCTHRVAGLHPRYLEALGWVGAILVGIAVASSAESGTFEIASTTTVVLGTVLLLLPGTVSHDGRAIQRLLATRPMTWIGDRSYAWYLTHWPFIVFAVTLTDHSAAPVVAAILSLIVAAVAHRFVEEPIRADRGIQGRRAVALVAVCCAVPVLVSVVVLVLSERHPVEPLEEAARQHFVYEPSCASGSGDIGEVEQCNLPAAGATTAIALIGDSHAAHYAEALRSAADTAHASLSTTTSSSCPMLLDLRVEVDGGVGDSCENLSRQTVDRLIAEQPDLVVLAVAGPRYIEEWGDLDVRIVNPDGTIAEAPNSRAAAWERGIRATLEALSAAGLRTLLVHDNPYPDLPPSRCGRLRHAMDGCESMVELEAATSVRARALAAERNAIAGMAGVTTLDPFPLLCERDGCPNVRDGAWLYRDAHHLSVVASEELSPHFSELVSGILED